MGVLACRPAGAGAGVGGRIVVSGYPGKATVPDEDPRPAAGFDAIFTQVSRARRANELFDEILGPFPPGVEPFCLVPRQGLDRVLAQLRLRPGDHLLDLCCGRGGIGLWFAGVSGARLTGADFSAVAIGQAARRAVVVAPRARASFIVTDAAYTGLPAATVDAVVCLDSLQFMPDTGAVLGEIARLLRPGGRVAITTWERRSAEAASLPAIYSITDAAAQAQAAGLRVLACEEHADWQEQERAFYQRMIAEDSGQAEPAIRLLADAGQDLLPHMPSVRRLLLIART